MQLCFDDTIFFLNLRCLIEKFLVVFISLLLVAFSNTWCILIIFIKRWQYFLTNTHELLRKFRKQYDMNRVVTGVVIEKEAVVRKEKNYFSLRRCRTLGHNTRQISSE